MASDPWAKYSQQYWGEQFRSLTGAKLQNPTEHSKRLIAQLGLDSFQVPDAQKHLAAQLGLIDRLGLMDFKATDYLQQINLQLKAPHQYTDFLLQQRTLTEQAILPLSNTLALIENINQRAMSQMKAVFENINQALATAKYIATSNFLKRISVKIMLCSDRKQTKGLMNLLMRGCQNQPLVNYNKLTFYRYVFYTLHCGIQN